MKTRTVLGGAFFLAASMFVLSTQSARCESSASKTSNTAPVSFYEIPLVCPAAPQIGCGSASKPLLLGLESSGVASEAWLNRAGTIMAVVWTQQSSSRQRAKTLKAILREKEITAKELTGQAKQQALKEFGQKVGWYRGADVDRLSEEEAGVIAARLVHRIREKITVTDEKAKAIEEGFNGVLRQKLTGHSTKEDAQEAMIKICRQHVSEKDVATLQEAFAAGVCALKDEK